jgi:hypothetical protein
MCCVRFFDDDRFVYGDEGGDLEIFEIWGQVMHRVGKKSLGFGRVNCLLGLPPDRLIVGQKDKFLVLHVAVDSEKRSVELEEISEFPVKGGVWDLAGLKNNRIVLRNTDNQGSIRDLKDGKELHVIMEEQSINDVTVINGEICTGTYTGGVSFWDPENYKKLRNFQANTSDSLLRVHEIFEDLFVIQTTGKAYFVNPRTSETLVSQEAQHAVCVLPNKTLVAAHTGKLSVFNFFGQKWVFMKWVFLGNLDENSIFFGFPVEIIFHIVCVTSHQTEFLSFDT